MGWRGWENKKLVLECHAAGHRLLPQRGDGWRKCKSPAGWVWETVKLFSHPGRLSMGLVGLLLGREVRIRRGHPRAGTEKDSQNGSWRMKQSEDRSTGGAPEGTA